MLIDFILHGALDSTVKDSYDRSVRVKVPTRFDGDHQAFVDEVLADKGVADQVAAVLPANDARPADIAGDNVEASQVRSSVKVRTQERSGLPFLSYVNMNRNPNFMTYRLAKHLVALLEDELPGVKRPETLRREEELKSLESLKADLKKYEGAAVPSSIQNTLSALNTQIEASMKTAPKSEPKPFDRKIETQYLRAAIEFGSKDGDLNFHDRSVEIYFNRKSPLTDTKGQPTQPMKDMLEETLFSNEAFSGSSRNSIAMKSFTLSSMFNPEAKTHGVRIAVTQVEEGRLLNALHKIMQNLSEGDKPTEDIRIVGDGNAILNHAIHSGRMLDTVRLRRQIPMIINPAKSHQDPFQQHRRTSEHLLMEARAYVAKHEKDFDAKYQEWRAIVEPLSEKTRHLSPTYSR